MTESEYWSCSAPEDLLHLLHHPRWTARLWLFAAGCCRRLEHLLPDSCRRLLDASERYARGQGSLDEVAGLVGPVLAAEREGQQLVNSRNMLLLQARAGRKGRRNSAAEQAAERADEEVRQRQPAIRAVSAVASLAGCARGWSSIHRAADEARSMIARAAADGVAERQYQADRIRCLFGNPFRPVPVLPAWRTPEVLSLAGVLTSDAGGLAGLGLADALEEAGCCDESLLLHARLQSAHGPTCWLAEALRSRV